MDTSKYVDSLFTDYQQSLELTDFKEELKSFLDERIRSLVKDGMDESDAFEKATSELGDMAEVADEISGKKKQEILGEIYFAMERTGGSHGRMSGAKAKSPRNDRIPS
jgi:glycyl-tRNA synthetase beta subunit